MARPAGTPPEQVQEEKDKIEAWDKDLTAKAGPVLDDILKRLAVESGYAEVERAPPIPRSPMPCAAPSRGAWISWPPDGLCVALGDAHRSAEGADYFEETGSILKDPHFVWVGHAFPAANSLAVFSV